ncbi:TIGR03915 family putative DNA repair protein [Nonlabens ponticola]|uniref:DNA metabolism protein n=1 Tax=Nonlabens ponticola TaxID=2496866 RepID=A0A3S9MV00_9FLAO|nr:TIGR03915 family putative DNA repair protein [Nonlabens ponticola]AZQ43004.1 DNA metabolism protein [Nonlabens ponticola]
MNELLQYDGSFNGFLTAVFDVYAHKLKNPIIQKTSLAQDQLFGEMQTIITDQDKADRVFKKLKKLCGSNDFNQFYRAFLSEISGIENTLLDYCRITFKNGTSPSGDYGNITVLKMSQAAKMVGREKHRMEAFIRFHLIEEDVYYANCEPDFNVLPLISKHFKNRYADQKWIIYDLNRDYGISYDLEKVDEVTIQFNDPRAQRGIMNTGVVEESRFRESENNYRDLWNQYFKSTNIESRKNMKLHLQHVPKRYWKYLSEKVA